jgi:hypothetical protein
MALRYTFDFDLKNRILRCCLNGRVTEEVFRDFFRTGAQHAIRTHPAAGVIDLSEVTVFEVSTRTIELLAKLPPVLPDPNLCRVIIAPSSEIFGMMRVFEIAAEQQRPNIHVVHTEQEAWAILSVEEPRFHPFDMM